MITESEDGGCSNCMSTNKDGGCNSNMFPEGHAQPLLSWPVDCMHVLTPIENRHRKRCFHCGALWEMCYACLLAGFDRERTSKHDGTWWFCAECR